MVSQQDVAKAAGVSPATVSLALNNHPRVSARMRAHVQESAQRLGYVANHAAQQLIRARFGLSQTADIRQVGFVLCHGDASPLLPVYLAFIQGVEQEVAARNGVLVFLRATGDAFLKRLALLHQSGMVEAWILAGTVTEETVAPVEALHRPLVILGDQQCPRPLHHATMDFRLMGRLAVRHLVELGHRQIGFVGACMRFAYQWNILDGFKAGMAEARLPVAASAIATRQGLANPRSRINDAVGRLLQGKLRPTALVFGEPNESELALASLANRGIRVPDDLSIVFCEHPDGGAVLADGITRVEAAAADAGRAAVSLLAEVAAQRDTPPRLVLTAPRLVPGRTTAPRQAP